MLEAVQRDQVALHANLCALILISKTFSQHECAVFLGKDKRFVPQNRGAVGSDFKGKLSIAIYLVGIALAFFEPWIAVALYIAVAVIWFAPDRRIETAAKE